ncbi:MAG TPA: Clp protease N-terminal domain-containing protein [Xanthomonadales bacterium]|nr:Clp protease N-terminal domain-containing protein [Xanthomonadales bacterium]
MTGGPFTERARRSMVLAHEEARRLGSNAVGTEHILLGIIAEGENVAVDVLAALGFDVVTVRREVEAVSAPAGGAIEGVQEAMPFPACTKRAIELAFEETITLGRDYIGSECLLLGIMREPDGVGGRVLQSLGMDAANARAQAVASLKAERDPPAP